jgi:aspartate/methionine/tyrosine aminotransferase
MMGLHRWYPPAPTLGEKLMTHSYYASLAPAELAAEVARLEAEVDAIRARGLKLNMARGKPSPEQLDLSRPLLAALAPNDDLTDGGVDCLNYGCLEGIPSARAFFGELLGVPASQVLIGGESSLTLMYDALDHAMVHGVCGGEPFCRQMERGPLKWVCLVPGYDRHFGIVSQFGFEPVVLPLGEHGPNVDDLRRIVESDPQVKGVWCVPKYSNPTGVTYSDEVVRAIAALKPAAPDFRVYWDNAYLVHDLVPGQGDELLNVFDAIAEQGGDPNLVYEFCSTSKITLPGAGVAAMAASERNLQDLLSEYKHRMIGHDKVNQLRHVRFLRDQQGLAEHMAAQAAVLRPRFELVERRLGEGLGELGCCSWTHPRGGYFVSFDGPRGSAKKIVELCASCGVTLTAAGATFPGGNDPADTNIRIAPSYPALEELDAALDVFVACVKLVSARLALEVGAC